MKYSIISLLLFTLACNIPKNDAALDGVYIASYEYDFGITDDTLTLTKANNGNGVYQITRHSGVIKKLDGKKFPKEIITEVLILDYNPDKQILTDIKQGRILIWDSNKLTLQLGNTKYIKISSQ
jgi:hypothetical protein